SYLFFVFMSAVAAEIYTLSLPDALPIFAVEIVLDALIAAFLAEAGLLESAEGRLRRGDQPFIDADQAIFQPLHHAEGAAEIAGRSEEHTSELQSRENLVCRLLLEKKKDT